jgi:putative transposase
MIFRFIRGHADRFSIERMCQVLSVSRSGYYAWLRRSESRRSQKNRRLLIDIKAVYRASRQNYGSPRVYEALRAQGILCSVNRVARLMRVEGIRAKRRRRFRPRTTDSTHVHPVAANLLDRKFQVDGADRVWMADITYIATQEGWLYLAVIIDLYSRFVVGWSMSARITSQLTIDALTMALQRRRPGPALVHHSDRGSQYASGDYRIVLQKHKIISSMSRKGNCYDHAPVESFFGTLKTELVHHRRYRSRAEAKADIFDYLEIFYNRQRLHSSLGYKSPAAFERLGLAA